jgi:hypothetical protein
VTLVPPERRRKSDHPAWALLRLAVIMIPITGVLWLNASKFDMTELKSLLQLGIVLGGWEGVRLLKGK